MRIRVCDLCGRKLVIPTFKIKVKKAWIFMHETGWDKMDICENCGDQMIEWIKKKKEVNADDES